MKKQFQLISLTLLACGAALAQTPTIDAGGVVNVASYAFADLPSGGIAQGSIFGIFGKNLGPAQYVQSTTYPLPTTLSGVSVKVTSGGATTNAILFFVSAGQINALLPSTVAAGNATLTVTNNGQTSAPASFKVVASSFGIFSLNQGGSGPGIITNAQGVPFGLTTAANPDDTVIIWGTGLGPVQGNEAGGALPGDTTVPIEIYVGAAKANVTYRGRSGCCAGLDQIVFTVPNVTGCHVSVTAKIGTTVGNYTTMAVAPKGSRTCSDPGGPSPADLQKFAAQGSASIGAVVLSRVNTSITVPFLGVVNTSADLGAGTFVRYTPAQLDASQNPFSTYTPGTCAVTYYKGSTSTTTDPIIPKSLDAGTALSVNGPNGVKSLAKTPIVNGYFTYTGLLSTISAAGSTGYLDPGTYSVSGPGGPEVGAFNAQLAVPAALNWTNQAAFTDVNRGQGQQVTWTGGDPTGTVLITGYSASGSDANSVGANFACYAKASDGQFTIPAQVLLALPPSVVVQGVPTGALLVGINTAPKAFSATGIDIGYLIGTVYSAKTLNYK